MKEKRTGEVRKSVPLGDQGVPETEAPREAECGEERPRGLDGRASVASAPQRRPTRKEEKKRRRGRRNNRREENREQPGAQRSQPRKNEMLMIFCIFRTAAGASTA